MDVVLRTPQLHNGLLKWLTASVSPQQQIERAASWRRRISLACVYPGGFVCPCARCCISILPHTEAHCLLFTVAQHILLSLLPHSSAHARYSGGWAEERNLRCWLELHSFINLWENHLTLRWPAEVISWPTPATSVKQSFLILVKVDVFVHFLSYVYTFINYDSCGIF